VLKPVITSASPNSATRPVALVRAAAVVLPALLLGGQERTTRKCVFAVDLLVRHALKELSSRDYYYFYYYYYYYYYYY
jgi:hypothetical protein